jgi:hypothetical protein
MSLEHSPARQRRSGASSAFDYELLTREQLAERLHVTPTTVTRRYRKWGLRPVRIGARVLFASDQIAALEQRLIKSGEVA